jgi:putative aminopeptidase FrvX
MGENVNLTDILREFMLTEALSGYEKKMAALLKAHLEQYADAVDIDRAGNVIAKFGGAKPQAPVVMVFAHMDQLGFIVRKIEENGLLQVDRLGGIDEKVLPALKVAVGNLAGEYIPGVIGAKSHHAVSAEEKYKVDPLASLLIDIGARNKKQIVAAGIRVGCPVVYRPSFERLMDDRVCGTAIDNRGSCAALVALAQELKKAGPEATVYLVGSVWEEFSIRGAIFAARRVRPDFAICLDIALSGDTPDLKSRYDINMGAGPTVCLYNFHSRGTLNGTIAHNGLYKLALKASESSGIPLQEFASIGLLTDNAYVQLEGEYIACLDMGFPVRYAHSPIECCDIGDIHGLIGLVYRMLMDMPGEFSPNRY